MAILPIIETPDPRLKTISTPVETIDDDLRAFIKDMFDTMYDAPGIGLAAIQVGVPKRVLVIDLQDKDEETGKVIRDPRVFINPEILEESEELSVYNEGCLSVPEQYADVCIQHEMDHLDGICFTDRVGKTTLMLAREKERKLRIKMTRDARK